MRAAMLAMAVAAAAMTAGCSREARSEDNGEVVERNYRVGNFDRIAVAGSYDVNVRTGSAPSVHVRGHEAMIDRLVVEVRDGVLEVHPKKRSGLSFGWSRGRKVELTVTVPALRGADLAGSGDFRIDRVAGDRFEGNIAGSGDLTVEQVEVGDLQIGIAGSGTVRAGSGRARSADYNIAGSGDIDAGGVAAETAEVSIAGAGDVSANASRTAKVSIMGSGDVEIKGGAKCSVTKAGSGNVRCV